jgi:hypothetical protein
MEGILKIPNFQIPNITIGCIKSAQNTQGATLQTLSSERKIGFCNTKKRQKNFVMKSSALNLNQSNIYGNFNKFPISLLQDK